MRKNNYKRPEFEVLKIKIESSLLTGTMDFGSEDGGDGTADAPKMFDPIFDD